MRFVRRTVRLRNCDRSQGDGIVHSSPVVMAPSHTRVVADGVRQPAARDSAAHLGAARDRTP
jgi:hypothetical protein